MPYDTNKTHAFKAAGWPNKVTPGNRIPDPSGGKSAKEATHDYVREYSKLPKGLSDQGEMMDRLSEKLPVNNGLDDHLYKRGVTSEKILQVQPEWED